MEVIDDLLWWLGLAVVFYCSLQFVCFVNRLLQGYFMARHIELCSFGRYACITGATDGIGKAYAFELAARGMNIVLISRTQLRLEDTAKEIKEKFDVDVKIVSADFTRPDIYEFLEGQVALLDVGVLVNNVGMASPVPRHFWELDPEFITSSINCNCLSVLMMSRIFYPIFTEKSKGIIVNVSSLAAELPGGMAAIYSGTKSAQRTFSYALQIEAKSQSQNIHVQDLAPGFVATKMIKQSEMATSFAISPSNFAQSAVKTVGHLDMATGCVSHEIQNFALQLVPRNFVNRLTYFIREREYGTISN